MKWLVIAYNYSDLAENLDLPYIPAGCHLIANFDLEEDAIDFLENRGIDDKEDYVFITRGLVK